MPRTTTVANQIAAIRAAAAAAERLVPMLEQIEQLEQRVVAAREEYASARRLLVTARADYRAAAGKAPRKPRNDRGTPRKPRDGAATPKAAPKSDGKAARPVRA